VEPPRRKGFGSRLIERGLAAEIGGAVKLNFEPSGVVCEIDADLALTAAGDAER
jgi:two-component sensor histidine kinase